MFWADHPSDAYKLAVIEDEQDFEEQAPRPKLSSVRHVPPLAAHSVRLNLPSDRQRESQKSDDIAIPSPETIYAIWRETSKIATRISEGSYAEKRSEIRIILGAYNHALSLGNIHGASEYRDTLVDAMAEHMDDYGHNGWWIEGPEEPICRGLHPMWNLKGFYFALSTHHFMYRHIGPLHPKPEENQAINYLLEKCWRQHLEIVKADGRTFKEIWDSYMSSNRCMFHEHEEGQCRRAKSRSDEQVRAVL